MIATWLMVSTVQAVPALSGWQVLRDDEVWIGCTWAAGEPWCRAVGRVDAPVDAVVEQLTDFERYAEVFERIEAVTVLDDDVVQMTLQMPFPLAPRAHAARFEVEAMAGVVAVDWQPVEHQNDTGAVWLPRYAGAWELVPAGEGTEVHFTWQAELEGDVPDWVLPRAHMRTGSDAMAQLAAALQR